MKKSNAPDQNHPTSPFRYMVIRTINTYIYAALICLVPLVIGTRFLSTEESDAGTLILTTIVGMLVLFGLTYSTFWGTAERDRNLVIFGHMKENKWRPVFGALVGMIPLAVLILLLVVHTYVPFMPGWFDVVCRVVLLPFILFMRRATDVPSAFSWMLIFVTLWSPIAAFCGYYNGYHLIRLMDKIIYKQKPRSRDKRLR